MLVVGALALLLAAGNTPSESPELRVRQEFLAAKMAESDGRLKEARTHLETAIGIRPQDPILEFEYALLLQQLDLDDEARTHARRSTELDANFDPAWALAGALDLASAEKRSEKSPPPAETVARAVEELEKAHRLAPQNPSSLVALCRAQLLNGRPDLARALLEDIPGLSDNPAVLKIRSQADDRRGADDEAARDYDRWVQSDPGDREAVASAIEFFESRRDYKRALELLRGLKIADDSNALIADRIALDRLRSGDFEGADRDARALAASRPEDRNARRTLAAVLYQRGREEESSKLLRKLLEEDPDDPAVVFTLVAQLGGSGKDSEALSVLEAFDRTLAGSPSKADLRREVQGQIASIRYRARAFDEAKKIAAASALAPQDASDRLVALLLQISRDEKKPEEGLSWAKKALAVEPKNPDFIAAVAEFQVRAGRKEEGDSELSRLASSGIAAEVLAAADAQERLKDYSGSARTASEALSRFSGNLDLLFRKGSALEREGKIDEAARVFDELLKVRPDDAQTLNYLGYMYAEHAIHLPQARRMIERAVELEPQNGAYLDSLGWIRFQLNDLDGAQKALQRAAERMPTDPTVQEHLGDIEARLGRKSEAAELWRKSLSLSPEEPEKLEKKIHDLGLAP
jgi:tetratricopeptide (TPR) repeat protein